MTEKEARELVEPFKYHKKFPFFFMDERVRVYGAWFYLEAIEKAKVLVELLDVGPHDPREHSEGLCWNCKRIEALAKWEKKK